MTLEEEYYSLAEKSLAKGKLDVDAYLVKTLTDVKRSLVGENISVASVDPGQDRLSAYMENRSAGNLKSLLATYKQELSEIYHSCQNYSDREVCKKVFEEIGRIC